MTTPTTVSPLRQRMTEDMIARRLVPGTQVGHIRACKRFAAWLKRDSVDMGDPQGPLRRVGLPLTNGHSPGGSWHGGSVPATDSDWLHALRLDGPVIMTPRDTTRHQVRKAAARPRLLPSITCCDVEHSLRR
jgi:hypothetical protein